MLIVDYGYTQTTLGESLQAVSRHAYVDPLAAPGEADLTTHVDFAALKRAALDGGREGAGAGDAREFPGAAWHRAARRDASRKGDRRQRADIDSALSRRGGGDPRDHMGELFKVMAVMHPDMPTCRASRLEPSREKSMSQPTPLQAENLRLPGLVHGFFTRLGGVSTGVYESLNGGVGSRDEPALVRENRARMARALGLEVERLLVPYQIHSSDALIVARPGRKTRARDATAWRQARAAWDWG